MTGWLLIELLLWAPGSTMVDGLQIVQVVATSRRLNCIVFGTTLLLSRSGAGGFFAYSVAQGSSRFTLGVLLPGVLSQDRHLDMRWQQIVLPYWPSRGSFLRPRFLTSAQLLCQKRETHTRSSLAALLFGLFGGHGADGFLRRG